jgi:hypothetical protein
MVQLSRYLNGWIAHFHLGRHHRKQSDGEALKLAEQDEELGALRRRADRIGPPIASRLPASSDRRLGNPSRSE